MQTPDGIKKICRKTVDGKYSGTAKRSLESVFDGVDVKKKEKLSVVKVEKD